MSSFQQQKITVHTKKLESIAHSKEPSKLTENIPEEPQMSDLLNNDFKTTVLKVLKELKGDMHKDKIYFV